MFVKSSGDGRILDIIRFSGSGNSVYTAFNKTYTFDKRYARVYVTAFWGNNGGAQTLTITKNGTTIYSQSVTYARLTYTFSVEFGDVVQVVQTVQLRQGYTFSSSGQVAVSEDTGRVSVPTKVVQIGELGYVTSYGRLTNGKWYGDFSDNIESSATTGSIGLGNCVGFMPVVGPDGMKYKIPVYLP